MPAAVANDDTACSASCGSNAGLPSGRHLGHRHVPLDERPPGQVERDVDQRLVEREPAAGEAADAGLVAERLAERLAERDRDVLDRVVGVDVQVARRPRPAGRTRRGGRAGRACGRRTGCRSSTSVGPVPSRSIEISIDVSFVDAAVGVAVRLMRGPPSSAVEERVVLVGGADGDAQAVGEPRPARAVADEHAAVERPCQTVAARPMPAGRNRMKLAPLGRDVDRQCAAALPTIRSRSATISRDAVVHLVDVAQREPTGDLLGRVEVVRQHDLVELGDEPRRTDEVAEPGPGHRPRLRERARDDERARPRRPASAPTSRRTGRRPRRRRPGPATVPSSSRDASDRLDEPGRVVRRAEERDVRLRDARRPGEPRPRSSVKSAARSPSTTVGPGDPGDVAVQLVRRLERGHGAARPGVGEQQRLQHLVRPVGGEHHVGATRRAASAIAARSVGRGAVGVAVPLDPRQLGREGIAPRGRRRERRLVGVQPHADVDLWRVVPLERAQVVADGDHAGEATEQFVTARNRLNAVPSGSSPPDPSTASAELHVIADTLERQRDRVAAAAEPFLGTDVRTS